MRQHADTITQVLDVESGQLASVLSGRVKSLRELLGQATEDLDTTLAGRTGEIGSVLAGRVNEIGTILANRLAEVQNALEYRGEGLEETLRNCLTDVSATLDAKGNDLVEQLLERQRELTGALDQSSDQLRHLIEVGTAATVTALVDANDRLSTDIASTLGQIDERNDQLQAIIANADQTFTAVKGALSQGVQQFQTAMTDITKEVHTVGLNANSTIASARELMRTSRVNSRHSPRRRASLRIRKPNSTARWKSAARRCRP